MKSAALALGLALMAAQPVMAFDQADLDRFFRTGDCPFCDLSGAELIQVAFKGAVLVGADLSSVRMFEVELSGANLTGADLTGAVILDSSFTNAIFDAADLSRAHLEGSDLRGARMDRTNLTAASLSGSLLIAVDMSTVVHRAPTTPEQDLATLRRTHSCPFCDLSQIALDKSDFAGADLVGADLHFSTMNGINLSGADLTGATFAGASMITANLAGADLTATDLGNATLWSADLSGAVFANTNLTGADLNAANLAGVDMANAIDRARPLPPPPPPQPTEQAESGSQIGRVFLVAYPGCPDFAHPADGTEFPIADRPVLYSVIRGTYGGDDRTVFALPDLTAQAPIPGTHFCIVLRGLYPERP